MWGFDGKALLVAAFVTGGKVLYKKYRDYIKSSQYVDRGLVPKANQLMILDNEISTLASQYTELSRNILNDILNFYQIYGDQPVFMDKLFMDFVRQKVIDNNAIIEENHIKYDRQKNLVWYIADPSDDTPFSQRKVIFLNASVEHYKEGSEKDMQGLATQIMAMKMLHETMDLGSLRGVIVVASISFGYHQPFHVFKKTKLIPDALCICEPTGRITKGPVGFAIGQKGHCDINVSFNTDEDTLHKRSESIKHEMAEEALGSFEDPFLGPGGYDVTEKDGELIIKRKLTLGESSDDAMREAKDLPTIKKIDPKTESVSMVKVDEVQPWVTPRDSRALLAATEAYRRTVSPWAAGDSHSATEVQRHPWFTERAEPDARSGYPARAALPEGREWTDDGTAVNPPTFAIGAGFVDGDESADPEHMQAAASVLARFPSLLAQEWKK